jgi:WD40 repeat protein
MTTGREHALATGRDTEEFLEAIPSPDGRRLATRGPDGIGIWDLRTARPLKRINGKGVLPGVRWTPDGRAILAGDASTATWWNSKTGQPIRTVRLPWKKVTSVHLLGSGKHLLCGTVGTDRPEDVHHLVDSVTGKAVADSKSSVGPVWTVSADARICLDERHVTGPAKGGLSLSLKDRISGRTIWHCFVHDPRLVDPNSTETRTVPAEPPRCVIDGPFVVMPTGYGIDLLETSTGKRLDSPQGRPSFLPTAEFARVSTDARMAAVSMEPELNLYYDFLQENGFTPTLDSKLVLVELATGSPRRLLPVANYRQDALFSSDGKHLITCHEDGTAVVWKSYPSPRTSASLSEARNWSAGANWRARTPRRHTR